MFSEQTDHTVIQDEDGQNPKISPDIIFQFPVTF